MREGRLREEPACATRQGEHIVPGLERRSLYRGRVCGAGIGYDGVKTCELLRRSLNEFLRRSRISKVSLEDKNIATLAPQFPGELINARAPLPHAHRYCRIRPTGNLATNGATNSFTHSSHKNTHVAIS